MEQSFRVWRIWGKLEDETNMNGIFFSSEANPCIRSWMRYLPDIQPIQTPIESVVVSWAGWGNKIRCRYVKALSSSIVYLANIN